MRRRVEKEPDIDRAHMVAEAKTFHDRCDGKRNSVTIVQKMY